MVAALGAFEPVAALVEEPRLCVLGPIFAGLAEREAQMVASTGLTAGPSSAARMQAISSFENR